MAQSLEKAGNCLKEDAQEQMAVALHNTSGSELDLDCQIRVVNCSGCKLNNWLAKQSTLLKKALQIKTGADW